MASDRGRKKVYSFRVVGLLVCATALAGSALLYSWNRASDRGKAVAGHRSATAPAVGLADVSFTKERAYGLGTVVTIHGTIVNSSAGELTIPRLLVVTLSDAKKRQLFSTRVQPRIARLKAGEKLPFETQIYNSPEAAVHLQVRLVD